MKTLAAFLLLVLPLPAVARIGETPEQLSTRYGRAWKTGDPEVNIYQKNGIYIVARVWKGACHRIEFCVNTADMPVRPTDGQDPLPGSTLPGLTDNQMIALVEANKGGSEWKRFEPAVAMTDTLDGSRIVEVDKTGYITITTKEWIDHRVAEQKREEDAVTEGF